MSALTIIDIRRSGRALVAACHQCGHRSTLMATNPKLPPDLEVVAARTKLACSACGSRDIQTYPRAGVRSEWLNTAHRAHRVGRRHCRPHEMEALKAPGRTAPVCVAATPSRRMAASKKTLARDAQLKCVDAAFLCAFYPRSGPYICRRLSVYLHPFNVLCTISRHWHGSCSYARRVLRADRCKQRQSNVASDDRNR